ncbi:MAG: GNAT family N-acetyltransferase [Candidatus Zixiibacteriota bacterium]
MFAQHTLSSLPRERWKQLARDSLLNQIEWLALWEPIGGSPVFFLSDGGSRGESDHAFSCVRFGASLWSRTQSHVDGLPGSVLSLANTYSDIPDCLRDRVLLELTRTGRAKATWVDYARAMSVDSVPAGWRIHWTDTHRLNLQEAPEGFDSATERHIRSGWDRGAVVRRIESESEARVCHELMLKTYRAHGRRRCYPLEFYLRLFGLSQIDERALWYLCLVDGVVAGSLIALVEGPEALIWHPFIDRSRTDYKPAYLMIDRLVNDSRKMNLKSINFGGSPVGAVGLIHFKERFGARLYRYPVFSNRAAWLNLFDRDSD